MTGAPPRAARLRAPSWRDPRLLTGVAMVLGSVVLGARVVATADDTVPVWSVVGPLPAGQAIGAAQLRAVDVRLDGDVAAAYVPASTVPAGDWVAVRTLSAGELLPRSATGRSGDLEARPVTLPLANVPAGVVVGAQVDVWVTWPAEPATGGEPVVGDGGWPSPERLLAATEVSAVPAAASGLGSARSREVQVLVPVPQLPRVLAALSSEADVVVVPVPGTGRP